MREEETVKENFSRDDAPTLGDEWDEIAGEWEIVDGAAKTESANAVARWLGWSQQRSDVFGDIKDRCRLTVKVRGSSGDKIRVYFPRWIADGELRASYAEITIAGESSTVAGWQDIAGATTLFAQVTRPIEPDQWVTVRVCFSQFSNGIGVYVRYATTVILNDERLFTFIPEEVTPGSLETNDFRLAALGTGDTAADVRFDSLVINTSKYFTYDVCPECDGVPWPVGASQLEHLGQGGTILLNVDGVVYVLEPYGVWVGGHISFPHGPHAPSYAWRLTASGTELPCADPNVFEFMFESIFDENDGSIYTLRAWLGQSLGERAAWSRAFDAAADPDEFRTNGPLELDFEVWPGALSPCYSAGHKITVEWLPPV